MRVSRFKSTFRDIKRWYQATVQDVPWLRAIGPVFSIVGIFVLIIVQLPDAILNSDSIPFFWPVMTVAFVFLYLLLVTIYANTALSTERRLRSVEQAFSYDKRGTLWNGGEPNIAFRIKTFNGILEGLNSSMADAELEPALRVAGAEAADDFADSFDEIYDTDVRTKKGGAPWSELRLHQKLQEWAEYDSATGWGIISVEVSGDTITLQLVHFNGLFASEGGRLFGYFVLGYCETVTSSIVRDHDSGRYKDCTSVESIEEPQFRDEGVTLRLEPL